MVVGEPGIDTPVCVVHVDFESFFSGESDLFQMLKPAFYAKGTSSPVAGATGDGYFLKCDYTGPTLRRCQTDSTCGDNYHISFQSLSIVF